ncbi:ATP-binding cassette domain-containing protein [Nitrospirillum iridis]|uniref:Peptide/nickel transport system ATP-binding protein n=1 Tax=Nitrospirillum iridis TaxID=765888 RepID=A0A7X0EI25_9PROT|nr:ABC transporter ATP-binding protein [Nitrospirillum iridis]MBB6255314.1 peptide/nickel transport system ATP-binding protein [Nitrospirillum iridis]
MTTEVPLVAIDALRKSVRQAGRTMPILDGISLTIRRGETLGIVGESGSGKSTLARALLQLTPYDSGHVRLEGVDLSGLSQRQLLPFRARMQMVFQDPLASLNPRATIGRSLEEPLIVHRRGDAAHRRAAVRRMLERMSLPPQVAGRLPHELSGGQRQRIGIARALMLEPSLLVCDEAVSALDLSIRAQILNLLMDLQQQSGIAMLFISHDLAVVRHIADRVAVMWRGQIVEMADTEQVWTAPRHPYTRTLVAGSRF